MLPLLATLGILSFGGNGAADESLAALCRPVEQGVLVDLAGSRFAPEQGYDPGEPVTTIDARQSMLLLPGDNFLLRTSTVYPGQIEFRYRTVGTAEGESTVDELGWRDGDVLQRDDAASSIKDGADLRMLVPGLAACDALAAKHETNAREVRFTDRVGRPVTLSLDTAGALTEAQIGAERYRYGPRQVAYTRDGHLAARWDAITIRPARPEDRSLLTIDSAYRPATPTGPLRATALGSGAYRIDGAGSGYHAGFVVGSRGIVLFDPSVSPEEAQTVRVLIERTVPGRKVTHVVLSHVHRDHVAGLPVYADAEIFVGTGGSAALRRQFGDRTPARMHEVTTGTTLDLGGRSVRVDPIASSHSGTMLVGFDPGSGTLFQGDLFYLPERGTVPAAFATGQELSAFIAREKLAVRTIVGVHGRSGTPADLDRALELARVARNDRGGVGRMIAPDRGVD